ncbi:MAG TPA: hypothetical protein DCY48_04470 [Candidatus Magasanikbacteria bacterium]|nr:MAG: hypothetical protein A3I74_03080 [Candidatus Magasanikbacteria bacterium RIFCSPLOWO2_02_FULL_47_16]OGH79529.1 MAG: hypothetical protein A3C10_00325 [Candidatus Magasanikbacteria bacterium RIFCSPHIGHO2_02_FULL_48_18]OGH83027.1 MAG: hypothetical protein A3G08_04620 [Candidatus Magasanikbacteria bacterium RIFCSPLOWO2_12_FULL_47_9b]HAZ28997.1 hypothetical protein [Candidatus Magasanikbacteria bacterium]
MGIDLRIAQSKETCETLWKQFSPKRIVYDDWDFRHCFFEQNNCDYFFIVGEENGVPFGVLPLERNKKTGLVDFFGGPFMEGNRVFADPRFASHIPDFYARVPAPFALTSIEGDIPPGADHTPYVYRYFLDIHDMTGYMDYLDRFFKAKTRNRLKRIVRDMEALHPVLVENRLADIDPLIAFNKEAIGEESIFHTPSNVAIFHNLMREPFTPSFMSLDIDGAVQSVSFSMVYEDTYELVLFGSNKKGIPNIGNYLILLNIQKAIEIGAKIFYAGRHDCNWKERWHLQKIPFYQWEKMEHTP